MEKKTSKPTYSKSELIRNGATVLNVSVEVIHAALQNVETDLTIEQAKKAVEEFLKKPVEEVKK